MNDRRHLAVPVSLLPLAAMGAGERIEVGRFSGGDLDGWQMKSFKAATDARRGTRPGGCRRHHDRHGQLRREGCGLVR
jgi:hypothetical protein